MTYQEFFKGVGDLVLYAETNQETGMGTHSVRCESISIEELFQHFAERFTYESLIKLHKHNLAAIDAKD